MGHRSPAPYGVLVPHGFAIRSVIPLGCPPKRLHKPPILDLRAQPDRGARCGQPAGCGDGWYEPTSEWFVMARRFHALIVTMA